MNAIEEMIINILETRFESFPDDLVQRAKDAVSDTIGCILGGANDTGCPMILDLIREWGGKKESTILVHRLKVPAHNAALVNAVMARSFDFGMVDICTGIEGKTNSSHIGETVVPTALAIAEQRGLSGKDMLTAVILGEDFTSRVLGAQNSRGDWNHTSTVTTFGATTTAGKLWGLDNRQFLSAFGIALEQIGSSMQSLRDRRHSFKLGQGLAAQRGIFSVRLAAKGFTGAKDPLFSNAGYFALYGPDHDPNVVTLNLGKKYYTEVTFKPYPSCRGTHGSIECALNLILKNKFDAGNIAEVTVIVDTHSIPVTLRDPFSIGDVPHADAIFSLRYTVANALLRGYPRPEHFTEESIKDPKIADMINKINVATQEFPNESFLASTVRVKLKDGREFTEHVNVPKGNELEHPLTREEKREKFLINAQFCKKVDMKNAQNALKLLEHLEDVQDINQIVRLLVG